MCAVCARFVQCVGYLSSVWEICAVCGRFVQCVRDLSSVCEICAVCARFVRCVRDLCSVLEIYVMQARSESPADSTAGLTRTNHKGESGKRRVIEMLRIFKDLF